MANVVLSTEGLTKSYGALVAVNELSLEVYEGEVLGFLGPNGAGKTTSIDMMCGLLKPDRGKVFIQGMPIDDSRVELRGRLGVCPQEVVLWERLTCLEQLQFMGNMYDLKPALIDKRSHQLLEELGLVEKKNKLASTLSGGMMRRLNFAMAGQRPPTLRRVILATE